MVAEPVFDLPEMFNFVATTLDAIEHIGYELTDTETVENLELLHLFIAGPTQELARQVWEATERARDALAVRIIKIGVEPPSGDVR